MGFNTGEIVLIIVVVVVVFGVGRLGRIGEAIGKMRDNLTNPSGDEALAAAPPRESGAPTADEIRGPVEDAELVDGDGEV